MVQGGREDGHSARVQGSFDAVAGSVSASEEIVSGDVPAMGFGVGVNGAVASESAGVVIGCVVGAILRLGATPHQAAGMKRTLQ